MAVTTVNTHFSFYDQNILSGFSMFSQRFRQPIEKLMIYSWSAFDSTKLENPKSRITNLKCVLVLRFSLFFLAYPKKIFVSNSRQYFEHYKNLHLRKPRTSPSSGTLRPSTSGIRGRFGGLPFRFRPVHRVFVNCNVTLSLSVHYSIPL